MMAFMQASKFSINFMSTWCCQMLAAHSQSLCPNQMHAGSESIHYRRFINMIYGIVSTDGLFYKNQTAYKTQ